MGHKYSNFADAFADQTANYTNYVQTKEWAYNGIWDGYDEWADPATKPQIYKIVAGVNQLINALLYVVGVAAPTWQDSWLYESIYWLQQEAGAVDMAAIIYAMLTAEPDEITYFVGLEDAFRQSIWNKPFNQEFYAALARGFME